MLALRVFDERRAAEANDGIDVVPPFALVAIALVHGGEAHLVMGEHRIELVPGKRRVEVDCAQLALGGVIHEVYGHPVGVVVIAQHRKNAPARAGKHPDDLLLAQQL